ncbi:hypothetical protein NXS98_00030 [Fontisphaera persica]|uniref:hypothetical protein n=1 Tax=Fontisphaera persica TaxID=2974023 RepID=UPI0024BF4074|nr:hypothetical protein [Fontisphaera persica]WCJ59541.1 hypothetical protein NXS98_00030 [Fontisphaera persica]
MGAMSMERNLIGMMLALAVMSWWAGLGMGAEGEDRPVFQTHYAVTGHWTVSYVISNRHTVDSYCYPFTLQRLGNQWRMKVASGTNGFKTYYDVGCDGTNIYMVHHDLLSTNIPKDRNSALVYPGIICTELSGEMVWFAFCRDTVPTNDKPTIPKPNMYSSINHYAHIYLHGSEVKYVGDEVIENGWFVVNKERLDKALLSPYLLTKQKILGGGYPHPPGTTNLVYQAIFRRGRDGMFYQHHFKATVVGSSKLHPEMEGFALPDTNKISHFSFEYVYVDLNEKEFSCYPVTGRMLDIIDYRLWDKEKQMFTHLYKSTNFLGTNELDKAAYVLDMAKLREEKKRGKRVMASKLPLVLTLIAVLLGPLGWWLLAVKKQRKNAEKT